MGLGAGKTAPWWPDGAIYAADFVNDRYMRDGVSIPASEAYSFTRASSKLADDSSGVWHSFAPNVLARTDRGALIEPAGQNLVANSSFSGAQQSLTNALDGLPTGWDSSKIDGIGVNGRIVALDTWLGLPSMTVRLWGNSTIGDAELRPFSWSNQASNVPAVQGDVIAQSVFVQRVGGSNANFVARIRMNERNSAGTYLLHQTSTLVPSDVPERVFASMAVSSPAAAKITGGFAFAFTGTFDVTLRVAAVQLDTPLPLPGRSPILTASGPGFQASDNLTLFLPTASASLLVHHAGGSTQALSTGGGHHLLDPAALTQHGLSRILASV